MGEGCGKEGQTGCLCWRPTESCREQLLSASVVALSCGKLARLHYVSQNSLPCIFPARVGHRDGLHKTGGHPYCLCPWQSGVWQPLHMPVYLPAQAGGACTTSPGSSFSFFNTRARWGCSSVTKGPSFGVLWGTPSSWRLGFNLSCEFWLVLRVPHCLQNAIDQGPYAADSYSSQLWRLEVQEQVPALLGSGESL